MATYVEVLNRLNGDTMRTVNLSEERALSTKATLERLYQNDLPLPDVFKITIIEDNTQEDGN
jgi:hypothetical protein